MCRKIFWDVFSPNRDKPDNRPSRAAFSTSSILPVPQLLGNQQCCLGTDSRDVHKGQNTLGELVFQLLISAHLAGGNQLLDFVADCIADAGDGLQLHTIVYRLLQRRRQVLDGSSSPLVGTNLENKVTLHLKKGSHVLK